MCNICMCEFNMHEADERPDQLCCGHQYCVVCWGEYLREKVRANGLNTVFSKCPQLRCNVVLPHSYFLKYLPEGQFDDGINYREKYMIWHCKQFTDHNRNIKWCPAKNCNNIIEKNDYALNDMVSCTCGT